MTQVQWHVMHCILHSDNCGKIQGVKYLRNVPGKPYGSLMDCKLLFEREYEGLEQAGYVQTIRGTESAYDYRYSITDAGLDWMLRFACGSGEQDWRPAEMIPEDGYA